MSSLTKAKDSLSEVSPKEITVGSKSDTLTPKPAFQAAGHASSHAYSSADRTVAHLAKTLDGHVDEVAEAVGKETGTSVGKGGTISTHADEVTWEGTRWHDTAENVSQNMSKTNDVAIDVHSMEEITQQRQVLDKVTSGKETLAKNTPKGNYGEMVQDEFYRQHGYERINQDMVTGLDDAGHTGIDGVYYNPDGHPPYIISEAKYGSSRLSKGLADGIDQMNIDWIDNRLEKAVGKQKYREIIRQRALGNVQSNLFKVKEDGDIIIDQLDDAARKMK